MFADVGKRFLNNPQQLKRNQCGQASGPNGAFVRDKSHWIGIPGAERNVVTQLSDTFTERGLVSQNRDVRGGQRARALRADAED